MDIKILSIIILLISNFARGNEIVWGVTFEDQYNLPSVMVNIEGEEVALTFDTGAQKALYLPMNLIDKIQKQNQTASIKMIKSIDLLGNVTESKSFVIKNLKLNSFVFKRVEILEYKKWGLTFSSDNSKITASEDIEKPVIGLGLFDGYVLTINYPERKIIVSDDDGIFSDFDNKWIPVPFHMNAEGLVIDMSDGIKNYQMILDSGATKSIIKEQSLSPKSIKINDNESDYKLISLKLANFTNTNVEAVILDSFSIEFQSDGLIGFDFLSKNIIKIDFKNQKLWIERSSLAVTNRSVAE